MGQFYGLDEVTLEWNVKNVPTEKNQLKCFSSVFIQLFFYFVKIVTFFKIKINYKPVNKCVIVLS